MHILRERLSLSETRIVFHFVLMKGLLYKAVKLNLFWLISFFIIVFTCNTKLFLLLDWVVVIFRYIDALNIVNALH